MTMKRNLLLAAAFAFTAQMAAALTANDLAATYSAEGYGYIQIRTGVTQIKVEAIKDGQKVEVIYDAATGAVLKSETHTVGTIAATDPGLRLRDVPRDFVQVAADGSVSSDDDDRGRGRGRGGDDRPAGAPDDGHHGRGPHSDDDSSDDDSDYSDDDHGGDDHGGGGDHGGGSGRG